MCVTCAWVCQHCISVWDPFTANSIKALEKVQRWAARWVKQDYRKSACVDTIRGQLQWPTVGKTSPPQHFVQVPPWSPPHHPTLGQPPYMPMTSPMTLQFTSHQTAYTTGRRCSFLGPFQSLTAFLQKWKQHLSMAPWDQGRLCSKSAMCN